MRSSEPHYSSSEVSSPDDAVAIPGRREGDIVSAERNLVVTRTSSPAGLRVTGEVDTSNSSSLADSIRTGFPDGEDPHLDLSGLSFVDISGIRELVNLAREFGPDRRLLIHGLPAQLETVMQVTGWTDLPGLELCNCRMDP
jgi:anti-anti-sigma factor